MHGDDVGPAAEFFQADEFDPGREAFLHGFGEELVVADDFHAEGVVAGLGYGLADSSAADDAQGFAPKVLRQVGVADLEVALAGFSVQGGQLLVESEDEGQGVLGHGAGVHSQAGGDDDAVLGGGLEVDVVEAGAGAGYGFEFFALGDEFGIHFDARAQDNGVGVCHEWAYDGGVFARRLDYGKSRIDKELFCLFLDRFGKKDCPLFVHVYGSFWV